MTERFDKFTERARRTLQLAQEEAKRLPHPVIGTEHLPLGLMREGYGMAGRVLANMSLDLAKTKVLLLACWRVWESRLRWFAGR